MLDKLSSVSSFARLALCLLLSTGAHGGLAFYDWAAQPASIVDGGSAVVVSLVPAVTEADQPIVKTKPDKEEPAEIKKPERVAKVVQHAPPRLKPRPSEPPKPVAKVIEQSTEWTKPVDLACAETQQFPQTIHKDVAPDIISENCSAEAVVEPVQVAKLAETPEVVAGHSDQGVEPLVEATPNYRSNPLPEYPYVARQKRWEGVVWLLVDVSSQGSVDNLQVEQSCGHRVLDRAASKTVKRWKFTPAMRAGVPVESQVRIPVRFRLEDS